MHTYIQNSVVVVFVVVFVVVVVVVVVVVFVVVYPLTTSPSGRTAFLTSASLL